MSALPKKCLAEAIGTFMLCFIGAGAIVSDAMFEGIGLLGLAYHHLILGDDKVVAGFAVVS